MDLLYQVAQQLSQRFLVAAQALCQEVVSEMQNACPVDSGALRNSIRGWVTSAGGVIRLHFAAGGGAVDYAIYVEYGTSNPNYPVQPFMRPAIDALYANFTARLMAHMPP